MLVGQISKWVMLALYSMGLMASEADKDRYPKRIVTSVVGAYSCQQCDKKFPFLRELREHSRKHGERSSRQCPYCKNVFQSCYLSIHMRVHTGEKPFICEVCDQRFSRNATLKVHRVTHDSSLRIPCPHKSCIRTFLAPNHLNYHIRNDHDPVKKEKNKKALRDRRSLSRKTTKKRIEKKQRASVEEQLHESRLEITLLAEKVLSPDIAQALFSDQPEPQEYTYEQDADFLERLFEGQAEEDEKSSLLDEDLAIV